MQTLTLTMQNWKSLIDLNDKELVSWIRKIYRYATDNIEPECADGGNLFFWNSFKTEIDSQKDIYEKRCKYLRHNDGKPRKKSSTTRKNVRKSTETETESSSRQISGDNDSPDEVDMDGVTYITGTDAVLDLSFEHLVETYPKIDRSDDYLASSRRYWSDLDDDEKRRALSSIDKYLTSTPDTSRQVFLSQYLSGKLWLSL